MKVELDALEPEAGRRLTNDEYKFIFDRVPRLCVDALVVKDGKLLIPRRSIDPFKGTWCLPGGTIQFGESFGQALGRILDKELGVNFIEGKQVGAIEHYPDGPGRHSISIAHVVRFEGEPRPREQADELQFFDQVPDNTQPFQAAFLRRNWDRIIAIASSL